MENSVHQRRFQAAVKVMKTLPADGAFVPSDDMLIKFYIYHEQATVGACNTTKPCGRDALNQAKWEAWKALGDMSKEEAMKAYVEELLQILEMIPVTEQVSDLLDVLEPFYEVVEDEDEDEDEDNDTTSKPVMWTFSGSSNECRGSSVEDVDDDVEDEDDAEDETGLTVANRAERGGSPVCNDSVFSLTKSTLGSLNTDEEDEELEHSRETSRDAPHHFFPLRTDDGGDVSEPEQPCEVYSDSRAEEGSGGLRPAAAPAKKPEGRGANTEDVGVSQDGKPQGAALSPLCTAAHGPVQSVILSAGRGRAGQSVAPLSNVVTSNNGTVSERVVTDSVNTQIAVALARLQDDMRSVLMRLNALEARAVSKVKKLALCCEPHHTALTNNRLPKCPSLISQISVAFLLAWPFVAHLLVQLYLKKKRKTKL